MNDILTLPGDIPGLLRRCSPVIIDDAQRGVVWGEHLDSGSVVVFDAHTHAERLVWAERLALDLSDATGRAHAAWWLAARHDLACDQGTIFRPRGDDAWSLHGSMGGAVFVSFSRSDMPGAIRVPSLADLDPNDPRLLPDGSRRVDAEALRRVVLHVAGRTT